MIRLIKALVIILGLMAMLSNCASTPTYSVPQDSVVTSPPIEIEVLDFRSGLDYYGPSSTYYSDYWVEVIVRNIGDSQVVFYSSEVELKDVDTGISILPFNRDKDVVSTSDLQEDLLDKVTLKPGQAVKGRLKFITGFDEAKYENIELIYGNSSIIIHRVE